MVTTQYASPLGKILLAGENGALCGAWFEGQKYYPADIGADGCDPVFPDAVKWLDDYFAGVVREPDFPLAPKGTAFQKKVWKELQSIPYGKTVTYGALAEKIGCRSARAVGGAVGRNPASVIIPCHRVVGSDGGLTGYAGGVERKIFLLKLENAIG